MPAQFEVLDRSALPRVRRERSFVFKDTPVLEYGVVEGLCGHGGCRQASSLRRGRVDARYADRGSLPDRPAPDMRLRHLGYRRRAWAGVPAAMVRPGLW